MPNVTDSLAGTTFFLKQLRHLCGIYSYMNWKRLWSMTPCLTCQLPFMSVEKHLFRPAVVQLGNISTFQLSYCFDFPGAKRTSTVKYVVAVRTLCVRFLTTMDWARNLQCSRPWTIPETKLAKSSVCSKTTQPGNQYLSSIARTTRKLNEDVWFILESVSLSIVFLLWTE